MTEISCRNCNGACCKASLQKPYIVALTAKELTFMEAGGNEFITIAEPVKYDREDVAYPTTFALNKKGEIELPSENTETWPLAAGVGRYIMADTCSYLAPDGTCSVYIQRPQMCRDFEVGQAACLLMREFHGVPLPPPSRRSN